MADKRLEIRIDSELLERVDLWTKGRTDVDNRSEAIRKLIEIGLQGIQPNDEEVHLSKGEELILRMLAQRWCEDKGWLENSRNRMNPKALFDALTHGQYWAIQTVPINPCMINHTPTTNEVNFVIDILRMWSSMIYTYNECTQEQKDEIAKVTGWTYIRFPGFCSFGDDDEKFFESMQFIIQYNTNGLREQLYPEDGDLEDSSVFDSLIEQTPAYKKMLVVYNKHRNSKQWPTEEEERQVLIALIQTYQKYVKTND